MVHVRNIYMMPNMLHLRQFVNSSTVVSGPSMIYSDLHYEGHLTTVILQLHDSRIHDNLDLLAIYVSQSNCAAISESMNINIGKNVSSSYGETASVLVLQTVYAAKQREQFLPCQIVQSLPNPLGYLSARRYCDVVHRRVIVYS